MRVIPLLLAALLSAGAAQAHGPKHHAPAEVKKEQKDWGIAGSAKGARKVEIVMTDDMRFQPAHLDAREGETLKLVVRNRGKMLHELVIGTQKELDEHAALMLKFPDMEHDEPYMVHVDPGKTGEIVWTFNRAGQFRFACLIAGHYQAGMVGTITVKAKGGQS